MIGALMVIAGCFLAAAGADTCDMAILHGIGSASSGTRLMIAGVILTVVGFILYGIARKKDD